VESSAGWLGFRRGIIIDVFQMAGMLLEEDERLKRSVRNLVPRGPKFFRCRVDSPSGPKVYFSWLLHVKYYMNKFEMFQTIISFINLIPPVFKLAYVHCTVYSVHSI